MPSSKKPKPHLRDRAAPILASDVLDPRLDPDKPIVPKGEDFDSPMFRAADMAKVFFARSSSWVRAADRNGYFKLNRKKVGTSRNDRKARIYTLGDIEQIAHALASKGRITPVQLALALRMVDIRYRMERLQRGFYNRPVAEPPPKVYKRVVKTVLNNGTEVVRYGNGEWYYEPVQGRRRRLSEEMVVKYSERKKKR